MNGRFKKDGNSTKCVSSIVSTRRSCVGNVKGEKGNRGVVADSDESLDYELFSPEKVKLFTKYGQVSLRKDTLKVNLVPVTFSGEQEWFINESICIRKISLTLYSAAASERCSCIWPFSYIEAPSYCCYALGSIFTVLLLKFMLLLGRAPLRL